MLLMMLRLDLDLSRLLLVEKGCMIVRVVLPTTKWMLPWQHRDRVGYCVVLYWGVFVSLQGCIWWLAEKLTGRVPFRIGSFVCWLVGREDTAGVGRCGRQVEIIGRDCKSMIKLLQKNVVELDREVWRWREVGAEYVERSTRRGGGRRGG